MVAGKEEKNKKIREVHILVCIILFSSTCFIMNMRRFLFILSVVSTMYRIGCKADRRRRQEEVKLTQV